MKNLGRTPKLTAHILIAVLALTSGASPGPIRTLSLGQVAYAQSQGRADNREIEIHSRRMVFGNANDPFNRESAQVAADVRAWLIEKMGFQDYSAQAERGLRAPGISSYQREVLEFNRDRLQIVNYGREAAVGVLGRILPRMNDERTRSKVLELTRRLVSLQPLPPPDEFPDSIESIRDEERREQAKTDFLIAHIRDNMDRSRNRLVADILDTIYSPEEIQQARQNPESEVGKRFNNDLRHFGRLIQGYVESMYTDEGAGQTRYLGRTFSLGLVRHLRKSGDAAFERELERHVLEANEFLGNYTSNRLKFVDEENRVREIEVRNGDFLMEYSGGQEARQISAAVVSTSLRNRFRAWRERMSLSVIMTLILGSEDKALEKRANDGEELTLRDRARFWLQQHPYFKRGYSHAGIASVYTDPETGLANAMAMDNYPNPNRGGVRWVGIHEQFAQDGPYYRFGLARYDAKKYLAFAQRRLRESNLQPGDVVETVPVYRLNSDENAETDFTRIEGEKYEIRTQVTQRDLNATLNATPETAEQWFQNQIAPSLVNGMKDAMVKDGIGFAYGFMRGAIKIGNRIAAFTDYCSAIIDLKLRLKQGIPSQAAPDRWKMPVRIVQRLRQRAAERNGNPSEDDALIRNLDLSQGVIGPATFATQHELIGEHHMVTYRNRTFADKAFTKFEAVRAPMNSFVLDIVENRLREIMRIDASKAESMEVALREALDHQRLTKGDNGIFNHSASKLATNQGLGSRTAVLRGSGGEDNFLDLRDSGARRISPLGDERRLRKARELRQTLYDFGFNDMTAKLRENLASGNFDTELNRRQIESNIRSYEVINAARELSVLIMTEMGPRENAAGRMALPNDRARLIELTARMMALQPINPPRQLPADVSNQLIGKTDSEKESILEAHFGPILARTMQEHTEKVVSDIANVLYGENEMMEMNDLLSRPEQSLSAEERAKLPEARERKAEIARIYALASTIIDRTYMDSQIGTTPWFGRALAGLVLSEAAKNPASFGEVRAELDRRARAHGRYLDNFVNTETASDGKIKPYIVAKDESGKDVKIEVDGHTMLLNRALSEEAGYISSAVVPGDYEFARELGLVGHLATMALPIGKTAGEDGMSPMERIRDAVAQGKYFVNEGYSHILATHVKTEPKTGFKMVWVTDSYPHPGEKEGELGGARLIDMHSAAIMSLHSKLGVARLDPAKVHRYFKEKVAKNGYPSERYNKIVFDMVVPKLDEDGKIIDGENNGKSGIRFSLTREDFNRLAAITDSREFFDLWSELLANKRINKIERGIVFGWKVFETGVLYLGMEHCSLFLELAGLENGTSLEEVPSKFRGPTKFLMDLTNYVAESRLFKFMHERMMRVELLKRAFDVSKVNDRIVSPSGIVAQRSLFGSIKHVDFIDRTQANRQLTQFNPYAEMNSAVTRQIEKALSDTRSRFTTTNLDPIEKKVIVRENISVYRAALNGDERMADAAELEANRQRREARQERREARQEARETADRQAVPRPARAPRTCPMIFGAAG